MKRVARGRVARESVERGRAQAGLIHTEDVVRVYKLYIGEIFEFAACECVGAEGGGNRGKGMMGGRQNFLCRHRSRRRFLRYLKEKGFTPQIQGRGAIQISAN